MNAGRLASVLAALVLASAGPAARAAPIQSPATIRAKVAAFLEHQHADDGGKLQVHVASLDPRLRLPRCPVALEAFLPPAGPAVGNTSVGVRCAGKRPWTVYVPAQVSVYKKVLVAAQPLQRGTLLQADDVRLARKDLARLPYGYITDRKDLKGKRLTRMLGAGQPVTPSMLENPPLVRRGQRVTLVAVSAGFEVRMAGRCMMNGTKGDTVKVRNLSSQRVVEGTVVGPAVVKVSL